jgi:hypothetical protein
MASYNWDHQDVILRVVASLQDRGYLVWVDTEQMKGATVDTMALAVEGSAVVLIGVSRAYKESSNCRMEAQYALQKKKPLVPLMLVDGYEADGWLGLLLGTSMWYALYGDTLSSASSFNDRMDALCRELGSRGRADAVHIQSGSDLHPNVTVPRAVIASVATAAGLHEANMCDVLSAAFDAGVSEDEILDAQDADDPKAALLELVAQARESQPSDASPAGAVAALRAELEGLRMRELAARAKEHGIGREALREAQGSENPKATVVDLLLALSARVAPNE